MTDHRDRIQALLTLAQHPNTPQAEAETALALASKLMQKHGLSENDIAAAAHIDDTEVVIRTFTVSGLYRVRRQNMLWNIARLHSCDGYRDFDEDDSCVVVLYGRDNDITAAYTLFCAADVLGARLLPRGDRSWRTTWWHGFISGIVEALSTARTEFINESPGSGLVLADRMKRAQRELRATAPPLSGGRSYTDTSSGAYASGQAAGRGFSTGGRSFTSGVRGEL
jgi:hypothetical protein